MSSQESFDGSQDSGNIHRATLGVSASVAASEEQGNSSMCSFEGFFINITEE